MRIHRSAEDKTQHTCCLVVKHIHRNLSVSDKLFKWVGKIVCVISLRLVGSHTVSVRAHLDVKTASGSLPCVVGSAPVAYDSSIESPTLLEDTVEQGVILTAMAVEPPIV